MPCKSQSLSCSKKGAFHRKWNDTDTAMTLFVERALFVVAPQDSGKSTQLRSMFLIVVWDMAV